MERKQFLHVAGATIAGTTLVPDVWANSRASRKQIPELEHHIIDKCVLVQLIYRWPRFVGKNG